MNIFGLKTLYLTLVMTTTTVFGVVLPFIMPRKLTEAELAKIIVEIQSKISSCYRRDFTPLHHAAAAGRVEELRALLQSNKYDINAIGVGGDTPLHIAVLGNFPAIIVELLEHGADVNKGSEEALFISSVNGCNSYGATPFYLAVANNRIDCVRALLRSPNVNVFEPLICGRSIISPLDKARDSDPAIIPLIRQYIKRTTMTALLSALDKRCGKASPVNVLTRLQPDSRNKILMSVFENLITT